MTKGHERAHFPTKEHMSFITVWLLCYPISQEMHAPIIVLNLISTSLFPFHSFTSTFLSYLGKLDLLGEMWTISSSPQLQTFKEALNVIWTTILIWCVCCHIQIASSHFHLKVKRVEIWASCVCSKGRFIPLQKSRNIHISWIWCLFHIFHFHRAKHTHKEYKCFQFPLPHLSHCKDQNMEERDDKTSTQEKHSTDSEVISSSLHCWITRY